MSTKADELKAKVAPADEVYALMGSGVDTEEKHHGQAPHHDQPSFPVPFGVSNDELRSAGVGHLYAGVGPGEQTSDEDEDAPEVVGG